MKTWKQITTHEELVKLHGVPCRCKIGGEQINDAKISVECYEVYICQNIKDGRTCKNKRGYAFSWWISDLNTKYECRSRGCDNIEIEVKNAPEPTPDPIPTEYAVLTNATESAKKQIAEFEQVLAQIKIDAMKLGTRDLARLIKALNVI